MSRTGGSVQCCSSSTVTSVRATMSSCAWLAVVAILGFTQAQPIGSPLQYVPAANPPLQYEWKPLDTGNASPDSLEYWLKALNFSPVQSSQPSETPQLANVAPLVPTVEEQDKPKQSLARALLPVFAPDSGTDPWNRRPINVDFKPGLTINIPYDVDSQFIDNLLNKLLNNQNQWPFIPNNPNPNPTNYPYTTPYPNPNPNPTSQNPPVFPPDSRTRRPFEPNNNPFEGSTPYTPVPQQPPFTPPTWWHQGDKAQVLIDYLKKVLPSMM